MTRLTPHANLIGLEAVNAAIRHRFQDIFNESKVFDRFTETSPVVVDIVDRAIKRFNDIQAREMEQRTVAADINTTSELSAIKDNIKIEKATIEARKEALRKNKQNIGEKEIRSDGHYASLEDAIQNLEIKENRAL